MSQFRENCVKYGRTDGRTDRAEFIGPFRPALSGVQYNKNKKWTSNQLELLARLGIMLKLYFLRCYFYSVKFRELTIL